MKSIIKYCRDCDRFVPGINNYPLESRASYCRYTGEIALADDHQCHNNNAVKKIETAINAYFANNISNISQEAEKLTEPIEIPYSPKTPFSILIIKTADNRQFIRPIGGDFDNGINDAIEEMNARFPGCKMAILNKSNNRNKYFISNGLTHGQVL